MQALAAVAALAFSVSWAYGLACLLMPPGRRPWLTLAALTMGLSLGGLTLAMFWIAWVWPGRLSLLPIVTICAMAGGVGLWLSRRDWRADPAPPTASWRLGLPNPFLAVLAAAIVLICAGIVFNAVYWPFADTDALAIYAPLARRIYEAGALPIGNLYEGYPMLVPLAYAYTHWAVGGVNEYWARLVPALTALGAVGAAAALGQEMRSTRVGLMAAALTVLTPIFCRWASSGYVDVPASFYVALTALGAWRWLNSHAWRDALLTGISAGLAMWTKSDALTLLVSLVALGLLAAFIQARNRSERPSPQALWMQAILMAGAILAVAGPWYARNLAELGFLLPNTAWTYLAPHDMASLLVMVRNPQDFRGSGWLFAGSLVYGGARVVFTGFRRMSPWTVLLAIVLPFFAAWWWLASYDVRFLVTIVPLLSVVGALMLHETAEMLATRMAPNWQRGAAWVGALLVLATAPFALQRAVDSKGAIVQNPLMSDADKHRVRLGGLYDLALAINALPAGSRVLGVPPLAVYHIDWARLPAISDTAPDMPPWNYSQTYDYVAYDFQGKENPGWSYSAVPILNTYDGYYLYPTHTINPPAAGGS